MGKTLLLVGLVIAAAGGLMMLGLPIGRLPGDIVVQRGRGSFYFPITSGILLSLVLSLLLSVLRR